MHDNMDMDMAAAWRWLAVKEMRSEQHARDTYFRESWADMQTALGTHTERTLRRIAVTVFKPDAVVMRQIGPALTFARAHGFVPVWHRRFAYNRHMNRAVRSLLYRSVRRTLDHLAVNDLYLGATDSLTVIFRDTTAMPTSTASERMEALKDSKDPNVPTDSYLRGFMHAANNMLSSVHVPDEPADVVREIGIMRDRAERLALYTLLDDAVTQESDTTAVVEAATAALYADTTAETLDVAASLNRLEAALHARATTNPAPATDALREMVAAVHRGEPLRWQPFVDALAVAQIDMPLWDRILIGSQYIEHHEPM